MKHETFKRTLAGVTAVLCVAGNAAATAPMLGGFFGANPIVASAEQSLHDELIDGEYRVYNGDVTVDYKSGDTTWLGIGALSRTVVVINGNFTVKEGLKTTPPKTSDVKLMIESVLIVNGDIILNDYSRIVGLDDKCTVVYTGKLVCGTGAYIDCANTMNIKTDKKIADYVPAVATTCITNGNVEYFLDADDNYYTNDNGTLKAIDPEDVFIPTVGQHNYGEPEWIWGENNLYATAKFTCINGDDEQTFYAGVSVKSQTPATCGEDGEKVYVASVTYNGITYTDERREIIPATGKHRYSNYVCENLIEPTKTEDGSYDDVSYCQFCGKELYREHKIIPKTGQPAGSWEIADSTAPDSNEAAVAALEKAARNIDGIAYTPVAVLGRQCVAGTNYALLCKVKGVYPNAKAQYQIVYVYEDLNGSASLTGRKHIIGGETAPGSFEANDGDTSYNANKEIFEAFDSAFEGLAGVDHRAIAYLGSQVVAGKNYLFLARATPVVPNPKSRLQFVTIYVDTENKASVNDYIDIKLGEMDEVFPEPTVIYVSAKEPTCTDIGNIEYWIDTESDRLYFDEALTRIVNTAKELEVPALGHDLGEPEWTWGKDNKTAHVTVTCKRCGEKIVDADAEVTVKRVEPTTEKAGSVTYKAAVTVDGKNYTDTKVEVLEKLKPAALPEITFEKGKDCVKLRWTEVEGAEKYAVAGYVGGKWKILGEGTKNSYVLNGLKAGTNYKVAVIAKFNGKWNTDYSNAIVVTPKAVNVPGITAESGKNSVKLTWTEVEGAEKYAVVGYVSGKWTKLAEGFTNSYVLRGLKAGTEYKVAVIAKINGKWNNDLSNAIVVTPASEYPAVKAQTNKDKFRLQWTTVEGAEKYGLAIKTNGKWVIKQQFGADVTTYTSPSMSKGDYTLIIAAKVDGKWKIDNADSRAITVSIS